MNSPAWIHRWIHTYEFWHMISQYSSWLGSQTWIHIWIHIMNSCKISWSWIHMRYFMTYEFIHEFMYLKNKVPDGRGPSRRLQVCGTAAVSVRPPPRRELLRVTLWHKQGHIPWLGCWPWRLWFAGIVTPAAGCRGVTSLGPARDSDSRGGGLNDEHTGWCSESACLSRAHHLPVVAAGLPTTAAPRDSAAHMRTRRRTGGPTRTRSSRTWTGMMALESLAEYSVKMSKSRALVTADQVTESRPNGPGRFDLRCAVMNKIWNCDASIGLR